MTERARRHLETTANLLSDHLISLESQLTDADAYTTAALMLMSDRICQTIARPTQEVPDTLSEHLYSRGIAASRDRREITTLVGDHRHATLYRQLSPLLADLTSLLREPMPPVVRAEYGVVKTSDYLCAHLVTVVMMLWARSGTPSRPAIATITRALLSVVENRHPGRSIEVRVPPVGAVQVGESGPTHRRGTPPNVVEMPARTFLDIACGVMPYSQGVAHQMTTSGVHANEVAHMVPVVTYVGAWSSIRER